MKLLLFSDLLVDGRADAYTMQIDPRAAFREICELAVELRVDAVCCAGNLYDQSFHAGDTADFLRAGFAGIDTIPVYIAPGRSDWFSLDSLYSETSWSTNVHIFREPYLVDLNLARFGPLGCRSCRADPDCRFPEPARISRRGHEHRAVSRLRATRIPGVRIRFRVDRPIPGHRHPRERPATRTGRRHHGAAGDTGLHLPGAARGARAGRLGRGGGARDHRAGRRRGTAVVLPGPGHRHACDRRRRLARRMGRTRAGVRDPSAADPGTTGGSTADPEPLVAERSVPEPTALEPMPSNRRPLNRRPLNRRSLNRRPLNRRPVSRRLLNRRLRDGGQRRRPTSRSRSRPTFGPTDHQCTTPPIQPHRRTTPPNHRRRPPTLPICRRSATTTILDSGRHDVDPPRSYAADLPPVRYDPDPQPDRYDPNPPRAPYAADLPPVRYDPDPPRAPYADVPPVRYDPDPQPGRYDPDPPRAPYAADLPPVRYDADPQPAHRAPDPFEFGRGAPRGAPPPPVNVFPPTGLVPRPGPGPGRSSGAGRDRRAPCRRRFLPVELAGGSAGSVCQRQWAGPRRDQPDPSPAIAALEGTLTTGAAHAGP